VERPSTPGQTDEALDDETLPPGAEPLRSGDPTAIDGHRLTARLAAGGTSIVYLARDPQGRHVTVKTTRARQADQTQARRFLRTEAACSRRLPPFCTAPLLVDGSDQTPPYLISEYVEGPSLAQYVDVLGPLEPDQMGALATALARAIAAVHGAGLIHCDLQPGNVLLAADGPRVIDFSIAQEAPISGRPAETGTVPYSPGWVAPERLRGYPAGPASDIFGWGCLIGYAATGHSPFAGEEVKAGHWSVARSGDLAAIQEPLRVVVEAALAVDPADRPSTDEIVARLVGGRAEVMPAAEPVPQPEEDLIPFDEPTAPMPRIAPGPAGALPPPPRDERPFPAPAPRDDRPLPPPAHPVPARRDDPSYPPPVPALRDDPPVGRPVPARRDDVPPRRLDHALERPVERPTGQPGGRPVRHGEHAAGFGGGPSGPAALPPASDHADIPVATFGSRPRRDPRRPRRLRAVAMVTAPAALVAVLATALAMAGTGNQNGQAPTVPGGAPTTAGQSPADPAASPSEPSRRSYGPRPASASSSRDDTGAPGTGGQHAPTQPGTPSRPGHSHTPGSPPPSSPSPTPTHSPTPSPTPTGSGGPKIDGTGTPTAPGTTH
jgi:serine/threonine protein kinase